MMTRIKSLLPAPLKQTIKKIWRWVKPPRIKITRFVQAGCQFEIPTIMEASRIASYGGETDTVESVLSEIRSGDVFYDIGACLGLYAMHAALLNCTGIAFEPDPRYRKRLKRNIRINRYRKKIRVVDRAVSDQAGKATLYTDGLEGNSPSLKQVGKRGGVVVNTDTKDNPISKGKTPPPDIIKLDIEDAEILALRGMTGLLSSSFHPRFIFVEFHPDFLPNFTSVEACLQILQSAGYETTHSVKRSGQAHYFFKFGTNEL